MNELSHKDIQKLVHRGHHSPAERLAVINHLRTCPTCRRYTAVDHALHSQLVLENPRTRPSPQFTAVFMESATRRSRMNHILKPLYSAGGLAILILMVLASWFVIKNNPIPTNFGETEQQLFDAVIAGDTSLVERLLPSIYNTNIHDQEGNALLPLAARTGNLEIVQLLLDRGTDVNSTLKPSGEGKTALMEASMGNYLEIIELLVAHGAAINQQESESGFSALHFAASLNGDKTVGLLLDHGADPNLKAKNGWTPLYYAARYGFILTTNILLEGGSEVDAVDNDGLTPMMAAILKGNIYRSDTIIQILLMFGADPNRQDKDGNSALHYAAMMDLVDVLPFLIKKGASLKLQNNEGKTPLDVAKYQLTREKLLNISAGLSESEAISLDEQLFGAVSIGNTTEAERLLKAGADPNARDSMNIETALNTAAKNSDIEMVELLSVYGADPNKTGSKGDTALDVAAMYNCFDIVGILLEQGADPNYQNDRRDGETALHAAVSSGNLQATQALLAGGSDVNLAANNGITPLIKLIQEDKWSALRMTNILLDAGADPNYKDTFGRSALHYAQNSAVAKLLIESGAKINMQDNDGQTALHRAFALNRLDVVTALINLGADTEIEDSNGKTPFDLAPTGMIEDALYQTLSDK